MPLLTYTRFGLAVLEKLKCFPTRTFKQGEAPQILDQEFSTAATTENVLYFSGISAQSSLRSAFNGN